MSKTLNEYIKEFGCYLQEKGKSKHTTERYTRIIFHLLQTTNKTPDTLSWNEVTKYVSTVRDTKAHSNKKTIYSAIKKYLLYIKFKHKNPTQDEYEREKIETGEDIFEITEKVRNTKLPRLTKQEAKKILDASKESLRDYAILLLFYHSWQRVGSIVNLNKSDIDWEGKINPHDGKRYHKITIRQAKRNQSYDIYVEAVVLDAIKEYSKDREEPIPRDGKMSYSGKRIRGYVFGNYRQKLYHSDAVFLNGTGGRLQYRAIANMMKEYSAKAGIKKRMHCHIWRRSGISIAESKGVPLSQIMDRSGHTNLQSIKPYLSPEDNETNKNISKALNLEKTKDIPKPQEPQRKPEPKPQQQAENTYIAKNNANIRIKELELEILKLKQKQSQDNSMGSYQ